MSNRENKFTAFSDERLKTDIKTIGDGLSIVKQLRGVTYKRTDLGSDRPEEIGFIAQEVEKVLPHVVLTGNDDYKLKSLDYGRITSVLIEAVKELSARVEELENK